jgi:hypothetical protein
MDSGRRNGQRSHLHTKRARAMTIGAVVAGVLCSATAIQSGAWGLGTSTSLNLSGTLQPVTGVVTTGNGSATATAVASTRRLSVRASFMQLSSSPVSVSLGTSAGSIRLALSTGTDLRSGEVNSSIRLTRSQYDEVVLGRSTLRVNTRTYPAGELSTRLSAILPPTTTTTSKPSTTAFPSTTVAPTTTAVATTTTATATTTTVKSTTTTSGTTTTTQPTTTTTDSSPNTTTAVPTPGTQLPPTSAARSMAYSIWTPSVFDTCSKETHDKYWTYGPDGKVYPTWHPPVDPATGCQFGHEHGSDPKTSKIKNVNLPFGYVNEQAMAGGNHRHEDHVGHKVEVVNDLPLGVDPALPATTFCNYVYKVHMGTHSADAFSQNLHEVFEFVECSNGINLKMMILHPFGPPGEFNAGCDPQNVVIKTTPVVAPTDYGDRDIPTRDCINRALVPDGSVTYWNGGGGASVERWIVYYTRDNAAPGFGRVFSQFYLDVENSSRFYDPGAVNNLGHQVDMCYVTGPLQARRDGYCDSVRAAYPGQTIPWNDPRSPFNGSKRFITNAQLQVENRSGVSNWYTDVFGNNYSQTPFAGSVKQYISQSWVSETTVNGAVSYPHDYAAPGVHSPN